MNSITPIRGAARTERLKVWGGQIDLQVRIAGNGPAIVYFHGANGLWWDRFLDRLAETHTIHAVEMPGTSLGDPYAIHKLDTYWDLLLVYQEAVSALGLDKPAAIGACMGGMVALDLAACYPALFSRAVVLDPLGLWLDDVPIGYADLVASTPEKVLHTLYDDPGLPQIQEMLVLPDDPDLRAQVIGAMVWTLGCTGKFLWPIPDQGLARRLHRVVIPVQIIWGRNDKLVPVVYADAFAARIADSRVAVIDHAGHVPQLEQPDQTLAAIMPFLAGS